MQVTYLLNGPMFNLLLFVILFYFERKWLLMRNLTTILPLKSKLPEKFQRFNAIDRSIKMLKIVEFSKILSIKTENCKIFYETQKEIYRYIQTFVFKVFQECSFWASKNGAVQILFLTPNRNMFAGIFVKSERFLAVLRRHVISMSIELRFVKWVRFLERTCIVKCAMIFLTSFCWL